MEHIRELRNIPIVIESIDFQQMMPKQFNKEWIIFLTSSPRTTGYPYAKKKKKGILTFSFLDHTIHTKMDSNGL